MQFQISRSTSSQQPYYFKIVASNGRILASSETYVNKADAKSAIDLIKTHCSSASVVDLT